MGLCISFLSGTGRATTDSDGLRIVKFLYCKPGNCGISSLDLDNKGLPLDPFFFGTFILSVLSGSFGMAKFLKNGPMTLVPRSKYGPSFLLALLTVGLTLVGKGVLLASLVNIGIWKRGGSAFSDIGVWVGFCLVPHLIYAGVLAVIAVGPRKALSLLVEYPGAYLIP